nr:hypothetical protein GCM10025732_45260 [Glycomyces mayteni]
MAEVGVPVEERDAVPAAAAQRQGRAQKDRAVAAEDDREAPAFKKSAEPIGEDPGVGGDPVGVEQPVPEHPLAPVVPRRRGVPGVLAPDPVENALVPQRPGELVTTGNDPGRGRAQP